MSNQIQSYVKSVDKYLCQTNIISEILTKQYFLTSNKNTFQNKIETTILTKKIFNQLIQSRALCFAVFNMILNINYLVLTGIVNFVDHIPLKKTYLSGKFPLSYLSFWVKRLIFPHVYCQTILNQINVTLWIMASQKLHILK